MFYSIFRRIGIPRLTFLALLALVCLPSLGDAQQPRQKNSIVHKVEGPHERLEMIVNSSRILTLEQKIPRAQLSNESIARLTPLSPNQIQIAALRPGVTQVNLWDERGQIWTVDVINQGRRKPLKRYKRIVIGVDPSGGAAEIGIVAVGLGYDGHAYVLKDVSVLGKPRVWGRRVSLLFHLLKANRVIAEKNFGGDMVLSTLRVVDRRLPVTVVQTARGKLVRAEPISALYADGLVHHVGVFDELEIEMTTWTPDSSESPNRMDALVWALTELMRLMVYDEVGATSF